MQMVNELLLFPDVHQRECINKGAQNSSSYCSIPSTIRRNPRDKRFPTSFRCSQCQQSEPAKGRVHQEHRDTNQKGRSHTARTRRTNKNVNGIAMELRKLNRAGVNNATNSVTVVAVLFATLALAAIFSVPGGDYDNGVAVMVGTIPLLYLLRLQRRCALIFTSLAVVVVQITLVREERSWDEGCEGNQQDDVVGVYMHHRCIRISVLYSCW